MAVDWNAHLRTVWSKCPVSVWGVMDHETYGRVVIVADSAGKRIPFTLDGTPIGHSHAIENDGTPLDLLRTRIITAIVMRTRGMIVDEALAELLAMENTDGWGMF